MSTDGSAGIEVKGRLPVHLFDDLERHRRVVGASRSTVIGLALALYLTGRRVPPALPEVGDVPALVLSEEDQALAALALDTLCSIYRIDRARVAFSITRTPPVGGGETP